MDNVTPVEPAIALDQEQEVLVSRPAKPRRNLRKLFGRSLTAGLIGARIALVVMSAGKDSPSMRFFSTLVKSQHPMTIAAGATTLVAGYAATKMVERTFPTHADIAARYVSRQAAQGFTVG